MTCEFDYCIYNRKRLCLLNEIRIDAMSMCEACELVAIPEKAIEKRKEKRLKEIEEQ